MGMLSVIVAAVASYAFGAIWYMKLADPWVVASGIDPEKINSKDPKPFVISGLAALVVAGMMRHVFVMAGVTGIWTGIVSGFGLGLFIATPWIVTNYAFAGRPRNLMLIDGGYATIGCTIMGLVFGIFSG